MVQLFEGSFLFFIHVENGSGFILITGKRAGGDLHANTCPLF
jgi:hypothetical protein